MVKVQHQIGSISFINIKKIYLNLLWEKYYNAQDAVVSKSIGTEH